MDLEYLKQFRAIKEVADIINEIEKLDSLVCQNEWDEVRKHLQDVSYNHSVEKAVHNSVNHSQPQSIQQDAANCRHFLVTLGMAKITEATLKHLGGN